MTALWKGKLKTIPGKKLIMGPGKVAGGGAPASAQGHPGAQFDWAPVFSDWLQEAGGGLILLPRVAKDDAAFRPNSG